ncbi:BspA family leucine-rich repeat surface protein [Lactiplantibacillus songbeiensis]|uniref:BspA family leucine-rich repeat surface protein n=1 Tax=Lactiplantibacillus songbeiensis TaxID=2559920 RepID=A0ABW4BZ29_9LACO|nr:BspA family leucine-rich repeat surface protein [Lactiplantibacillus songbeiensis]
MTLKTKTNVHQDCQQWLTMLLITTGMTAGLAGHQLVGQADTENAPDNATSGQPEQVVPGSEQPKEVTLSQTSGQGSQSAAASGTSQTSATAGSAQSMQSGGTSSVGSAMPSEAGGAVSDQSNNERSAASVPTSVSSAGGQLTSDSNAKPVSSAASVSSAAPANDKSAANGIASNRLRSNLQQSRMAAVTVDTPELTLPANGVYGTANWDINAAGVLTIHAGQTGNATIVKPTWGDYDERITSVVVEDGVVAAPDAAELFANLKNATTIDLTKLDTSKTWNMSSFFDGDEKLADVDLTKLDTSQVSDMSNMFKDCRVIEVIDLTNFDTSNVIDMSNMFDSIGDFYGGSSPILKYSDKFVTSRVTNMSGMFYGTNCQDLSIVGGFDTSHVTNMARMFAMNDGVTSLNLAKFNTSNVTNMSQMFNHLYWLSKLDLSSFDTSQVSDMSGMFETNEHLNSLNISNFDTSKVTNMGNMFDYTALTSLDLSPKSVKNFSTDSVTDMRFMFSRNRFLKTITLGTLTNSVAINMNSTFAGCPELTTINGLDKFGTGAATMMESMFSEDTALTAIDLSHFDTRNIETMRFMFYHDTGLVTANISNWNFDKEAILWSLFTGCTSLTSVNLTGFTAAKGVGLAYMFNDCSSLTEIDLSKIDMSGAEDQIHDVEGYSRLFNIFAGCTSLWKVTMGPNTILTSDIGLPDAPGNHTQLTDDTGTYINVEPYWQLVDDGGHHTPTASLHHPEGDLQTAAQVLATDKPGAMRTYVWQQTVPATVTIQYQDENQKELQPSQSFRGVVNDTYQVGGLSRSLPDLDLTKPTITGYTFKMQQGDTPDGVLHSPSQVVTYVYTRTIGAPITVAYFDDTNQKMLATATLSGPIGDAYQSTARSFEGYTLVAKSNSTEWRL